MTPQIDLVAGDFWGSNPHEVFAWLRANDPVYFDEKNGIWGIARYDDVKANLALSVTGTNFKNGMRAAFSGAGITVVSVVRVSAKHLMVTISVAANVKTGARSLTLINKDGGRASTAVTVATVAKVDAGSTANWHANV